MHFLSKCSKVVGGCYWLFVLALLCLIYFEVLPPSCPFNSYAGSVEYGAPLGSCKGNNLGKRKLQIRS
jgi:hypothetical protein